MHKFDLIHDEVAHRYTLTVDGRPSSFADYRLGSDATTLVFHHTVTPVVDRNQGFAAELVARALEDVRSSGRTVVATCWYVEQFIREHSEYHDLVAL